MVEASRSPASGLHPAACGVEDARGSIGLEADGVGFTEVGEMMRKNGAVAEMGGVNAEKDDRQFISHTLESDLADARAASASGSYLMSNALLDI